VIFIPGKVQYRAAHHHIGKSVRKRHLLNEPDLKILSRKPGPQGRSQSTNMFDPFGVSVQSKHLAALAQEMDQVLGIACPNILFPYVREVISDVVVRAGFPPVILSPVNFEAIYQSQHQQPAASGDAAPQIITPSISH